MEKQLEESNSSIRISNLFNKALNINNCTYSETWIIAFDLEPNDHHHLNECFALLKKEIDFFFTQLQSNNITLRENVLSVLKSSYKVIDYGLYNQPWNSHKQKLLPSQLLILFDTYSTLIPLDEGIISTSEIKQLLSYISNLKGLLSNSLLSISVKEFVNDLILKMENAIISYKINGSIVLKEVSDLAVGRVLLIQDELKGSDPSIKEVISDTIEGVVKMNTTFNKYYAIPESISKVLKLTSGL